MANIIGSVFSGGVQVPISTEVEKFTFITNVIQAQVLSEIGIEVIPGILHEIEAGTLSQPRYAMGHQTACSPTYTDINKAITKRNIKVYDTNLYLEQCLDVFKGTYMAQLLAKGIASPKVDEANPVLANILNRLVTNLGAFDVSAKIWFANTASADSFFSKFDGFFKLYETELSAPQKFTIADTATAGNGLKTFDTAYENQSDELFQYAATDKIFLVTRKVFQRLVLDLANTDNSETTQNIYRDLNGNLTYQGIQIVCLPNWDTVIREKFTTSSVDGDPNRLVLTVRTNNVVGTDVEADIQNIETVFDNITEKNLIKSKFKLGVQVKNPNLVVYGRS